MTYSLIAAWSWQTGVNGDGTISSDTYRHGCQTNSDFGDFMAEDFREQHSQGRQTSVKERDDKSSQHGGSHIIRRSLHPVSVSDQLVNTQLHTSSLMLLWVKADW